MLSSVRMKKSLFLCMWLRLHSSITPSSFVLRPLSLIAYANPFLYVALLALHITAPLEFTVTPLRPPLDDLAVATATAEEVHPSLVVVFRLHLRPTVPVRKLAQISHVYVFLKIYSSYNKCMCYLLKYKNNKLIKLVV